MTNLDDPNRSNLRSDPRSSFQDDPEPNPGHAQARRRRPPAIDVDALANPSRVEMPSGHSPGYASPSRGILDTIGAPRAIQRVHASIAPAETTAPRAYGGGDDLLIQSVGDIGARVREKRNALGMTQQRFADLAGVGRRFLIELEAGKPGLKIGLVLKVCKAAGIKLGFLA